MKTNFVKNGCKGTHFLTFEQIKQGLNNDRPKISHINL